MSIPEIREKIKSIVDREEFSYFLEAVLVLLVGLAGFGLGRLYPAKSGGVRVENTQISGLTMNTVSQKSADNNAPVSADGRIFASKNGKKYYLPTCASASRVSDKNKVFFATENEAISAGYSIASACK